MYLMAPPALAQSSATPSANQNILSILGNCRSITDPAKRLACFDQATGSSPSAPRTQTPTAPAPAQQIITPAPIAPSSPVNNPSINVNQTQSQNDNFGRGPRYNNDPLTAPPAPAPTIKKIKQAKAPKPPKAPKAVTMKLVKATTFGYKKIRYFFENGQVWQQIDSQSLRPPRFKKGVAQSATISRASLGSFLLRLNGKERAVRVKRIR